MVNITSISIHYIFDEVGDIEFSDSEVPYFRKIITRYMYLV